MKDNEIDDLNEYLEVMNPLTKKKLQIVSSEDIKQNFMMRLDTKVPKSFIPRMPISASNDPKQEDRTIPRVSVAPDVLSCILAMGSLDREFLDGGKDIRKYFISGIYFHYAVKPSNKLLFDVDLTNEHWLLGYSKNTYKYIPFNIGSLFIVSVDRTFKNVNSGKKGLVFIEAYVHIEANMAIRLTKSKIVKPGYYALIVEKDNNAPASISKIDKKEYDAMRNLVISNEARRAHERELNKASTSESILNRW